MLLPNEQIQENQMTDEMYEFNDAPQESDIGMDLEDDKILQDLTSTVETPSINSTLIQQIIQNCCGKTSDGIPKAAITVSSEMWALQNNKARTIGQQSSHKPTVFISKRYEFIQVDLKFASYIDNDLKALWNMFEKYGIAINDLNESSTEMPFISMTIVPLCEQGVHYIVCTNPVFWALQPERPGQYANTIRLYFRNEDFGFYESDEIDMYEIESSAQRVLQTREMAKNLVLQKQEEEAEYQEQQNAKLEAMRRDGLL